MNFHCIEIPLEYIKNSIFLEQIFPVFDGIIYSMSTPFVTYDKVFVYLIIQNEPEKKTDTSFLLPYIWDAVGRTFFTHKKFTA